MSEIALTRRAEIAMRSLAANEEAAVRTALGYLAHATVTQALQSRKLHRLRLETSDKLYSFRATPTLRLVLAFSAGKWWVEDILHHSRIDRFLRKKRLK